MFDAILVEKNGGGSTASLARLDDNRLPESDITVRVSRSTLNYKDGLAITGKGPVVRAFPIVPGIDFAGVVDASNDPRFSVGDLVLLNGFGVGETHWGGLSELARVSGDWLIPLPDGLTAEHAMALGTAGYTAMLCVMALQRQGVSPDKGEIIVTGAGGGVGGVAIIILNHLGYHVVASTGRPQEADYLHELGANEIIDRATLSGPGKPLSKARWAGAVDSVGSHTLANVCAAMKDDGVVTACGLAQGMDFPASVAPFILRGVMLIGINSVYPSIADRTKAWTRLTREIDFSKLDQMTHHDRSRRRHTGCPRPARWQSSRAAMEEQGITKVAMAARMKTSRRQLDRLLDPAIPSVTLDTLRRAASAVGRTLRVELT